MLIRWWLLPGDYVITPLGHIGLVEYIHDGYAWLVSPDHDWFDYANYEPRELVRVKAPS
jgi:hypothetical protein